MIDPALEQLLAINDLHANAAPCGTSRFVNTLRRVPFLGRCIDQSHGLYLGDAVDMMNRDDMEIFKLRLHDNDRSGHFGCLGTTRIGKTRMMENMIEQDIRAGNNVIVIDPKGDAELFSKIVQVAAESGRLRELMQVTPIFPDISLKIDPLAYYYMPDELVDHTISGIRAKEEYYISVASEVSSIIIQGMIAMSKARGESKVRLNFQDIHTRGTTHSSVAEFVETLKLYSNHPNPEVSDAIRETVENAKHILNSPADFFAKVSSSLRTTLTSLTTSTTGAIIGKATTNEFIRRFEDGERVILLCNTGSLLARRTAHVIGRVFVSMIQSTVGRFFASNRTITPPLCLYIDEGHNILYQGIQELFNKAGGAGVWISFFTQSLSQIEEEIGQEACQSIVDNINTWAYMRVNHDRTAQFIEDSSPLRKLREPYLHFDSGDLRVSLREKEERMILKERVIRLRKRWFYLRRGGEFYKVRVPEVSKAYVNVQYPTIRVT